jgi:GR25 family glycosyltransferase involved in LPS biosynthesis
MIIIIIILIITLLLLNSNQNIENFTLEKLELYLINLEHRKDRFEITNNLLKDYNFNDVIRFPAVLGINISNEELIKIVEPSAIKSILNNYRKDHHELSYGAVGCYLSHVNIWKKLEFDNLDYAIIFEDDALPNFSFFELKDIIKNYVPDDWDIILFGGIYNNNTKINDYILKIFTFYEMHAYIINKKGALKLLPKVFPIKKQIDSLLSDLASNNEVNMYGITQNKWTQNPQINNTDIQTEIK